MDILALAASTILILITSFILLSWIFNNPKKESRPPLPPGPLGLPIVGYLPFLQENLHHQFTKLAHKYGPIYKLRLGSKLCVVISSPTLIKEVVRDHDAIFANRDPPVAAIVATGGLDIVWTPYGQYWRDIRKLFVRELLSNTNLDASYVLRKEEVRKLVRDLYNTKMGQGVDVGELAFLTEVNVILSLIWGGTSDGEKPNRIETDFRQNVSTFVDLFGKTNVSDYFPILAKFDLQGVEKDMRNAVSKVEETFDFIIRSRMKLMEGEKRSAERRKDFLEILLELKDHKVAEKAISLTQIKKILLDIVVGGTDTTATTVEWAMAEILYNPDVMSKVQQELADVVGMNNLVEEFHTPKLHYLEAVVKETFRLHSPLPLILPRLSSQSCTIGGYTIPNSSTVYLNMWSISSDPLVWKKPLEFRAERFMDMKGSKIDYMGNNFEYLPFGSGRRVCPGLPLAVRMVMYLLATLFHSFDWRLPAGEKLDLTEKFGIVVKKRTPLVVVPSQRLESPDMYA